MAVPRICSIPDCNKNSVNSRGWCTAHYLRWRRHGSPLGGKISAGVAEQFLKSVLTLNPTEECIYWPFAKSRGYGIANVDGVKVKTHRWICEKVHGKPPSDRPFAIHKCGRGHLGCINSRHLQWGSQRENMMDRIDHATDNRGEKCGTSKLTEDQARYIKFGPRTESAKAIAGRFRIHEMTIYDIRNGRSWNWLLP